MVLTKVVQKFESDFLRLLLVTRFYTHFATENFGYIVHQTNFNGDSYVESVRHVKTKSFTLGT